MVTNQDHVILRSRIEVTIDTDNKNQPLYEIIYEMIQQKLLPLLSKLFSKYAPSDIVVHLDKLIIDGGNLDVSIDALPYAIEERLILKLKQVLNKVIQNPISGQVIPVTRAKQEAIAHYLSEGYFSWWMVERSEEQIEKLYLALLNKHPKCIEGIWFNLAKKEIAVQRCIRIFKQSTLEHTLSCLLKQPITSFVSIISETALLLCQNAILSSYPYNPEQQLLGMALLATLTQQKYNIDRIYFLHILLKQVATTTSISYEKILQKLYIHYIKYSNQFTSMHTIQPFLRQLYDIVIIPPKCYHQDVKNQGKVLKVLDTIGSRIYMDTYQLSEAIKVIQIAVEQPGIRLLIKSWLKEASNREKLAKYLPEQLFVEFMQSIEPSIITLFGNATKITRATATTTLPESDLKLATLAYCAFKHSKKKYVQQLQVLFRKNFDRGFINQKKFVTYIISQMAIKNLSNKLDANRFLFDKLDIAYYMSYSDQKVLVENKTSLLALNKVVNFLLYNELPKDELVPAYVIVKSLEQATPKEIYEQLAPWCKESTFLKKLMEYATESVFSKLIESFVPSGHELFDSLTKIIIQANLFYGNGKQNQTTLRLIQKIGITTAIKCRPFTTQKQYIIHILFHLSNQFDYKPTILCQKLIDSSKEINNTYLVEVLSLIKENIAPFDLDKLDKIDLILLAIEEKLILDQSFFRKNHHSLLPAIKNSILQADIATLSQKSIHKLVVCHLPTLGKTFQKEVSLTLYKEITYSIQSKKKQVEQRWKLFLRTGKLGNYPDATHLLNDVIAYLSNFSLAKAIIHVRQRLITNFSHTQLMLLVKQQTHINQGLINCIEATYQLWCSIQGVLGQQNTTKNLFWNSLLKILPSKPISTDDWLAQIITTLSNVLAISLITLLETFQLLISDTKNIPVVQEFTKSLDRLQKYQTNMQQKGIQCGCTEPILRKLHLLLHSNLSTFSHKYFLSLNALSAELTTFIDSEPLAFLKFLQNQDYNPSISRRIIHYFDQSVIKKIITCLSKENSPFVDHYFQLLTSPGQTNISAWNKELSITIIDYLITKTYFKANLFIAYSLSHTIYPRADKWKIIASIISKPPITYLDTQIITLLKAFLKRINKYANLVVLSDQFTILKHLPAKKDRFSEDKVRVYSKNSGLIFIWPFLYNFFKKHNLMTGNQFASVQGAHNGIYLLQYLVTGKLKSPEWQLTLPKLLCGLSYDAVLLPYRPIDKNYEIQREEMEKSIDSQSEAIQSQILFQSVLKSWKEVESLKTIDLYQEVTTQAILQNYFLNRLGILTRHAVYDEGQEWLWHLMMMRKEYDHTTDLLPPWSMNRIKLPWMKETIIPFWAGS